MDDSIIELDIDDEPGPSTTAATATVADTDTDDKPKRKRRTKEEIEAEKTEKEVKRIRREMISAKNAKCEQFLFCYVDRSVCMLDDAIEQEIRNRFVERAVADQVAFVEGEYEKEVKRIRREMNSAKNAKCEQFLFCYVDRSVCMLDEAIEQEIRNRFVERAVADQVAFVEGEYGIGKIIWKRKRIDAIIEEGKVKSLQTMDIEGCFIHVLEGSAFTHLIKKGDFHKFVEKVSNEHGHSRSLPNIVVFGQGGAHTTQ
uniref:Uncharacterized protein n=1 Tax=Panagrolaimus sp. ES5 TaxID=591445 RepID=A0AC34GHD1_9BILA